MGGHGGRSMSDADILISIRGLKVHRGGVIVLDGIDLDVRKGNFVGVVGPNGSGKSTLLLQFALSSKNKKILYVSGEESQKQIKMRAERIEKNSTQCYILTETSMQNIFQQIENTTPQIL